MVAPKKNLPNIRFTDFTHSTGHVRIDYATGLYIKLSALIIYDPVHRCPLNVRHRSIGNQGITFRHSPLAEFIWYVMSALECRPNTSGVS